MLDTIHEEHEGRLESIFTERIHVKQEEIIEYGNYSLEIDIENQNEEKSDFD